jgi:hypothetical protein
VESSSKSSLILQDVLVKPPAPVIANIVYINTNDDETFPVKRRLLRPCIALTSVVQAGKGKYSDSVASCTNEDKSNKVYNDDGICINDIIHVDVDACTFDRVLLYLEHEARMENFKFDPLIANELLAAAITLGIRGLQEACEKVLGNFQERVRRVPITLDEIIRRNAAGGLDTSKRSDTLIILDGMVLVFRVYCNILY